MSPSHRIVENFVVAVRRRKNRHRLWSTLIWSVVAAAALVVAVGLGYVLRGHALPSAWIAVIVGAVLLGAAAGWLARRFTVERAAHWTDRFFQLQDTVTSYLHFSNQGRREGYYALQARQTADRIAELNTGDIRYRPPRRLMFLAAGLVALAVPISLCPPSDEVRRQLALEEQTSQETAAINERLLKEAEKLIEETRGTDEEKLIEPDKLRRWVEELKTTRDRDEALRQYARLERKLKKARLAVERKKDEQLLDRAAKELAKEEATKPMAELLKQKQYEKAGERLKDLEPKKTDSPDRRRRDLARLKAITQRMVAAARMTRPPAASVKPTPSKQPGNAKPSQKQGRGGKPSASGNANQSGGECGEAGEGELAETIGELADAIEACEKCDGGEPMLCEPLDELAKRLKKLGLCRRTDCRLARLCRCCGECQSNLACACQSPNAGGLKPGWGSNTYRREDRDELVDNGQTTQLKGLKGRGPSLTAVEAAQEGSGISNRRATAQQRAYQRQFESFVQREDVPEAVKDGVKQYFEIIHETDVPASSEEKPQE